MLGNAQVNSEGRRSACGAKTRTRGGAPCQAAPVRGKQRCRMHGGASTGPRTPEGLERSRRARVVRLFHDDRGPTVVVPSLLPRRQGDSSPAGADGTPMTPTPQPAQYEWD